MSNGTFRPARGAETCDGELCCGAAKVPVAGSNGAWMTIETCGAADQKTYNYQPPRDPLALTMPAKQPYTFTCIQGAQKVVTAVSTLFALAYSMA